MNIFMRFASGLAFVGMLCAGIILTSVFFLIITEIVLRSVFGSSTHIVEEFVGYGVAWATFLGLGYAFQRGTLVRVDFLLQSSKAIYKKLLEIVCVIGALVCTSTIQYSLIGQIHRDYVRGYASGTVINIPAYIPKLFIVVGLSIFVITLIAHFVEIVSNNDRTSHNPDARNLESAV